VQTFLPIDDFKKSVQCLDYRRLGKQRVECLQIFNALTGKSKAWVNHPATRMWAGYEDALCEYWDECVKEWVRRKYLNAMSVPLYSPNPIKPSWFGEEKLHSSHRAALLYKDINWYSQFNWDEIPELNYWWPV